MYQQSASGLLNTRPRALFISIHLALLSMAVQTLLPASNAYAAEPANAVNPANTVAKNQYAIKPGALGDVLAEFAAVSGVKLSFDPAMVAAQSSKGLQGAYSINNGFATLLNNSGYELVALGTGAYSLRKLPMAEKTGVTPEVSNKESTLAEVKVNAVSDLPGNLSKPFAGGQVARGASLGILGNTDIMDAPFNVTSYTSKTINDQQSRSLADVLANDPSVRVNTSGGPYEYLSIRGFDVAAGDVAFNGLYGLMPERRTAVDYAERVEVLKGPSALLGGISPDGSVGGTINVVPKRAQDKPLTEVAVGFVSDSQFTTRADISRRFGDNGEFGVRFNGSWRDGDTTTNDMSKTLGLGALALDYRGERVRISLDTITQKDDENGNATTGMVFAAGAQPRAPDNRTAIAPGGFSHGDDKTGVLHSEFDITSNATIYGSYGQHRRDYDAFAGLSSGYDNQGIGYISPVLLKEKFDVTSSDVGLRTHFETGPIQHALSLSATSYQKDYGSAYSFGASQLTSLYNPLQMIAPATSVANPATNTETALTSQAVADAMSFAHDRVLLTLGVRKQQVKVDSFSETGATTASYDERATTPMFGLVVKPWEAVSLYANYIEGLKQGPTAPTTNPALTNPGQIFPPYKTKQREVGVKRQWGNIGTSLSLFEITQPNQLTQNNTFGLNGEQRNRGLEFNLYGEAARNVRVLGGATFMDARVTKADASIQGNHATGIADTQINVATEWDVPFLPGMTLTARTIYTSSQYVDATNTTEIPGWMRWDIGARYATNISSKPVLLRGSVENLFDRNYWASYYSAGNTVTLGAPRTIILSATVSF